MLYKQLYVLKGANGERGFLKVDNLENAYTQAEITISHPILPRYYYFFFYGGEKEVFLQESHKASVKKNHPLQNLEIWVTNEEGKPLLTYGQTPQGEEEVHVYFAPPTLAEKGEEDGKEGDEQEKGKEEPQPSEEQTPAPDLAEVFDIKELQGENTALEKDEYYARFTREFEEQYPEQTHNATLEEYFPHSKWIENENDLSLGILYNDGGATHVCYAVKGSMDAPPAADAEWAEGYWVTFEETE